MLKLCFFLTFIVAAGPIADQRSTALPVTWRNFVMLYFWYDFWLRHEKSWSDLWFVVLIYYWYRYIYFVKAPWSFYNCIYCCISAIIIDMYTTTRSNFSSLPYGHSRIKLNTDFNSIHLIRIVFNINDVQYQTGPIHESDNHIFAKIPGVGGSPDPPPPNPLDPRMCKQIG